MNDLNLYIQSYFEGLGPSDLQNISSLFKEKTINKGDFLLKEGKKCDNLSFIQSGMLRIFALSDGKEITQWISTKGYFCTDLASFSFNSPLRWSIQALVDTKIYNISKADYNSIN